MIFSPGQRVMMRIGARRFALRFAGETRLSVSEVTLERAAWSWAAGSATVAVSYDAEALGREVPEELWAAVAEAFAWAYSVSDAAISPNR
jgi:hypothetical protein